MLNKILCSSRFNQDYKDPNKPVIRQPTISLPDVSTDMPEQVHCPYCNKQVLTRIQRRYGLAAGLISAGKYFLSLFCRNHSDLK
jgi:hypothetical protein